MGEKSSVSLFGIILLRTSWGTNPLKPQVTHDSIPQSPGRGLLMNLLLLFQSLFFCFLGMWLHHLAGKSTPQLIYHVVSMVHMNYYDHAINI